MPQRTFFASIKKNTRYQEMVTSPADSQNITLVTVLVKFKNHSLNSGKALDNIVAPHYIRGTYTSVCSNS